jgi:hypothetical protein
LQPEIGSPLQRHVFCNARHMVAFDHMERSRNANAETTPMRLPRLVTLCPRNNVIHLLIALVVTTQEMLTGQLMINWDTDDIRLAIRPLMVICGSEKCTLRWRN